MDSKLKVRSETYPNLSYNSGISWQEADWIAMAKLALHGHFAWSSPDILLGRPLLVSSRMQYATHSYCSFQHPNISDAVKWNIIQARNGLVQTITAHT
jgi:hypothetical protein